MVAPLNVPCAASTECLTLSEAVRFIQQEAVGLITELNLLDGRYSLADEAGGSSAPVARAKMASPSLGECDGTSAR